VIFVWTNLQTVRARELFAAKAVELQLVLFMAFVGALSSHSFECTWVGDACGRVGPLRRVLVDGNTAVTAEDVHAFRALNGRRCFVAPLAHGAALHPFAEQLNVGLQVAVEEVGDIPEVYGMMDNTAEGALKALGDATTLHSRTHAFEAKAVTAVYCHRIAQNRKADATGNNFLGL
jgi:hypothetical protein